MAFGQAAGIAASIAIRFHKIGRDVPARQIQDELLPHAANPYGDPHIVLHYFSDVPPTHKYYRAIQYLASRGFLPKDSGDKFEPDKPVTSNEMEIWLNRLAGRANPAEFAEDAQGVYRPQFHYKPSYMGVTVARKFNGFSVMRKELCVYLEKLLPYQVEPRGKPENPYADLGWPSAERPKDAPEDANVEAPFPVTYGAARLHEYGLDSRLWDGWEAYAPDGKLLLHSEREVTRGEAFAAFYVIQIGLGPLFNDHPLDSINGRYVPAAPLADGGIPARNQKRGNREKILGLPRSDRVFSLP